jgi:hypothetical protein
VWLKQQSLVDTWDKSYTEWFIVFEHGDMPYWWAKYLQSGFRHCWALRWDGFNWIAYHPKLGHTDIEILPYGSYEDIEIISKANNISAIIRAKVWRDSLQIRAPWPTVSTCVEQIKAILGVRKWFLFTPFALFNYLLSEENKWADYFQVHHHQNQIQSKRLRDDKIQTLQD